MRQLEESTRVVAVRLGVSAVVIAILAMIAPAIATAIRAGAGLLVLGAMLLVAWASLHALPYVGQRIEVWLLRARMHAARENPLEEMLSRLVARSEQLARYRAALAAIAAQIEGMRDMLAERSKADPSHDTTKQAAALQKMSAFHAYHVKQMAVAQLALADYREHLDAKRFEWNFALAGERVLESLHASDRESIVRELLSDEATRSVQANFNRVFATLELELQAVQCLDRDANDLGALR
jgi:hypothetical protein